MAVRRVLPLAAIVAIAAGVAVATSGGGGGGGTKRARPVLGTPAQAVATVQSFARALAGRDFATICDSLFSSRARRAAGGDNCQSVLAQAGAHISRPTVQIQSVVLGRGRTADVGVIAATARDRAAPDIIRLVREGGRFRIVSAGNPVLAAPRGGRGG